MKTSDQENMSTIEYIETAVSKPKKTWGPKHDGLQLKFEFKSEHKGRKCSVPLYHLYSPTMDLPALPEHENRWPQNVYTAEGIISNIYNAAIRILRSNDAEPTRVAYHYDALSTEALPLLEAIESDTSPADYQLLHDWLLVCARLIGEVAAMLKDISGNLHV
jgi:hypothetical protein